MNRMGTRFVPGWVLLPALVLLATACEPVPGTVPVLPEGGRQASFIVNGTLETGWPAVGALTATMRGYYVGEFCTGTLIAPQWVLTAAHCVTPTTDFPVTAAMTRFLIGSDAQPTGSPDNPQPPLTGTFYQADKLYPHPAYTSTDTAVDNDVALVHLVKAVAGVTPILLNTKAMDGSFLNQTVDYVGFGATEGINSTGSGVKRSGTMELVEVNPHEYMSVYGGQGVCFGDSGGPGLFQVGGEWKVIGVNSTVGSDGTDPCRGVANHMRVDVYAPWITGLTDLPPPDCRVDAATCECTAACQADGTCNSDKCQNFDCQTTYDCLTSCPTGDDACVTVCHGRATPEAQVIMGDMVQCFQSQCDVPDAQFQECAMTKCTDEINACYPGMIGDLTCEQAYDCMVQCNGNQTCTSDCYSRGNAAAQGQLGNLFQCFQVLCGSVQDQTLFRECALSNCEVQLLACMPPADCEPVGVGTCPEGLACWNGLGNRTDCYPSDGLTDGVACDATTTDALPCADGLACVLDGAATVCRRICRTALDCGTNAECKTPLAADWTDVGYCLASPCIDADGDGTCVPQDCDDGDSDVFPGANEYCGNRKDDNCNGETDEGCAPCVDTDADGYCADVDCNDDDPNVRPGAVEVCGNGIDDDCNGGTDETCQACGDDDACSPVEEPKTGAKGGGCAAGADGTGGAGGPLPAALLGASLLGWALIRRRRDPCCDASSPSR